MKWLRMRPCWMTGAAIVMAIGRATATPVVKGDQADANINRGVTIPARDAWRISMAIQARMADASLSESESDGQTNRPEPIAPGARLDQCSELLSREPFESTWSRDLPPDVRRPRARRRLLASSAFNEAALGAVRAPSCWTSIDRGAAPEPLPQSEAP